MTVAFAIGFFLACAFVCALVRMLVKTTKFALKCSEDALDHQRKYLATLICLNETKRELEAERVKKSLVIHVRDPSSVGVVLDDQLKGLVRLAVSNPEPEERATAASIVCKRLKEMVDG